MQFYSYNSGAVRALSPALYEPLTAELTRLQLTFYSDLFPDPHPHPLHSHLGPPVN